MKKFLMSLCALVLALSLCGACAESLTVPMVTLPEVTVIPGGAANNDELFDA